MNTKEAGKHTTGSRHVEAIKTKDGTPMYRVLNHCGLGIGDFATWHDATLDASAPKMLEVIAICANEADYALRYKQGESVEDLRKALYSIKCALESAENEANGRTVEAE